MYVSVISDLHGYLPDLNPCELVLICGDIVPLYLQRSSVDTYIWYSTVFKNWAMRLKCQKVIFIAGNHKYSNFNLEIIQ